MCNQAEKCWKMSCESLQVLTGYLKEERKAGAYSKCRNIINFGVCKRAF